MKSLPCALILLVLPASNFAQAPHRSAPLHFDIDDTETLIPRRMAWQLRALPTNYIPNLANYVRTCRAEHAPCTNGTQRTLYSNTIQLNVGGGGPNAPACSSLNAGRVNLAYDHGFGCFGQRPDQLPATVTLEYHCYVPAGGANPHLTLQLQYQP